MELPGKDELLPLLTGFGESGVPMVPGCAPEIKLTRSVGGKTGGCAAESG